MKETSKRVFSLLLALVLVFSNISGIVPAAYATETEEVISQEVTDETPVSEEAEEPAQEEAAAEEEAEEPVEEPAAEEEAEEPAEEPIAAEEEAEEPSEEEPAADEETEESSEIVIDEIISEEIVVSEEAVMATADSGVSGLGMEYTEAGMQSGTYPGTVIWKSETNAQSGAVTIRGSVSGYKAGANYRKESNTLTLTNNLEQEAVLSFTYELSVAAYKNDEITIDGISYIGKNSGSTAANVTGSFEKTLKKGEYVEIYTYIENRQSASNAASIVLRNVSLNTNPEVTTKFLPVENGSYTVSYGETTVEIVEETTISNKAVTNYTLIATPAEGYSFAGWYDNTNQVYFGGRATSENVRFTDETTVATVNPLFIKTENAVYGAGETRFLELEPAIDYALNTQDKVIAVLKDVTLNEEHTIPEGITLLIPFDEENTLYTDTPGTTSSKNNNVNWVEPTAFRTLTLASSAVLNIEGAISVSAQHSTGATNAGSPTGPYGHLVLNRGAKINVEDEGVLYAWGYVTGSGEIEVKTGGEVWENLQITDFRGGTASVAMVPTKADDPLKAEKKVFPFSQYYVQNIEVAMKIHSGAAERVSTTLYALDDVYPTPGIEFIGTDSAMFSIGEGSYVVKDYDPSTDRLNILAFGNGEIAVNSLSVTMAGTTLDSSMFNLPITNNITINVYGGTVNMDQDISLLPGSQVNIAEGATLNMGYGYNVYVYDQDDWTKGIANVYDAETGTYSLVEVENCNFVHNNRKLTTVPYSPSGKATRNESSLVDAKVDVNGTLNVQGNLYTTSGGANIISSEGTGMILLATGELGTATHTNQVTQNVSAVTFVNIPITPAKLKNADGSYTNTADLTPVSAYTYDASSGKWVGKNSFAVKFDGNGATGSVDPMEVSFTDIFVWEEGSIVLPDSTGFEKNNAEFLGWSTDKNADKPDYVADDFFEVTEDVTLYAIWKVDKGTINYTTDDAEMKSAVEALSGAVEVGNYTLPAVPAKTGYDGHWELNGATVTEVNVTTDGLTVNAVYVPAKYTVTWIIDGTTTTEEMTYGADILAPKAPTKEGNTFTGWTYNGATYQPNDKLNTVPVNGITITLTSKWDLNSYTITWIVEGEKTTTTVDHGKGPAYGKADPTKAKDETNHYTFAGWSSKENGAAEEIGAAAGEATYYAVFTAETHTYETEVANTKIPSTCKTAGSVTMQCSCGAETVEKLELDPSKHESNDFTYECKNNGTHEKKYACCGVTAVAAENCAGYFYCSSIGKPYYGAENGTKTFNLYFYCETCKKVTIKRDFDAVPVNEVGTCQKEAVTTYTWNFINIAEDVWSRFPVLENSEADFNYTWNAETKTATRTIIGDKDLNNHESEEVTYDNITATTHDEHYKCCGNLKKANVPHTYLDGKCVCTAVQTFSVTLNLPEFQEGLVNVTLSNTTATYGQAFTAKVTADKGTGIMFRGANVECSFNKATGELTIPAEAVDEDILIDVAATVQITMDVNGGVISDGLKESLINAGAVIEGDKITMTALYAESGVLGVSAAIRYEGHTYAGIMDAAGKIYEPDETYANMKDDTLTFLWKCDTLTPVEGKTATCIAEGNKAYYECSCGKWYEDADGETPIESLEVWMAKGGNGYLAPDAGNHESVEVTYDNITATTHDEHYKCCGNLKKANVPHDFKNDKHQCDCNVVEEFTLTFTINGEAYGESVQVAYGAAVTAPAYTAPAGYTFSGWDVPAAMPAENITLDATLTVNKYKVTWNIDGVTTEETVEYGTELKAPAAPAEGKEGNSFTGWKYGEATKQPGDVITTVPAHNNTYITLTSKWDPNTYKYTIETYEMDTNGVYQLKNTETKEALYGTEIDLTKSEWPEHFYLDGENIESNLGATIPANNDLVMKVFLARESLVVKIHWNEDDYTWLLTPYYEESTTIPTGTAPEGHTFLGYAKTKDGEVFITAEEAKGTYTWTESMDLYAIFEPITYTVTFTINGEAYGDSVKVAYGAAVTAPEYTAEAGYEFSGWEVPATMPAEDITLNAILKAIEYTLTIVALDFEDGDGISNCERKVPVPYGALLKDYVTKDYDVEIYQTGDKIEVAGDLYKGIWSIEGWYQWTEENGYETIDLDTITMPVGGITITQDYSFTGWEYMYTDENGDWTDEVQGTKYSVEDDYYRDTVAHIDGEAYLFDEDGYIVAGAGLVRHVTEDETVEYYYFCDGNCGDTDCTQGEASYTGFKSGIHWLHLNNDLLPKWDYSFDARGVIQHREDTSLNGLVDEGEDTFYFIDGVPAYMGLIKEGEDHYYVRSSGKIVKNASYWISKTNKLKPEGTYAFDEEGKLIEEQEQVKNGIVAENGGLYYYVDGVLSYAGLIEIDGEYYYVRSSGKLAQNEKYWISKTNGLLPETSYTFDADGKIILTPEQGKTTGIINGYYYENGKKTYAGLIEIDGYLYYVNSSCKVIMDQTYWISKTNGLRPEGSYTFDAQGRMVEEKPEDKLNGIVDGYYYVNGVKTYAGLIEIDGSLYYVNSSCKVIMGQKYWISKTNGLRPEKAYTFDATGKLVE